MVKKAHLLTPVSSKTSTNASGPPKVFPTVTLGEPVSSWMIAKDYHEYKNLIRITD